MFAAYCQEYPEMEALWEKYHSGVDADSLMNNEKLWLEQEKPEAPDPYPEDDQSPEG